MIVSDPFYMLSGCTLLMVTRCHKGWHWADLISTIQSNVQQTLIFGNDVKHGARVETSITLSCNFFTNMNHKFHYSRNEILRNRSSYIYRHACTLNVTCALKQFTAKYILKLSKLPHLTCDISVCWFHLIFEHVSWMTWLIYLSSQYRVTCCVATSLDLMAWWESHQAIKSSDVDHPIACVLSIYVSKRCYTI